MTVENPSILTARMLVGTLVAARVAAVAYCPGSRNAPFAYALAEAEKQGLLRVGTFSDERSAAFWAIGFMKATGGPCAVVTTSGTAVAELHAGAEEALHQELPLILITADRPHHMRGVGASQTTAQEGLFGASTVASAAIPAGAPPEPGATSAVLGRLVERAVSEPGPVHLNVAFEDPLVPVSSAPIAVPTLPVFKRGEPALPAWEDLVDPHLRTVVIAADSADVTVLHAASQRSIPVLAEPTANLMGVDTWIPHAPEVLNSLPAAERIQQVVVAGHPTLSRPVTALLGDERIRKVVVSERRTYPDLAGTAAVVACGMAFSSPENSPSPEETRWLRHWQEASTVMSELLASATGRDLNLLSVSRVVWETSGEAALWLAASNAVRGFDLAATHPGRGRAFANRGLAGIDGTVASALGLAQGLHQPVRAVVGDMAFAADLSTLTQRPGGPADLQVLVLNDEGGSIFASLEHGSAPSDVYRRFFAVPPRMNITEVAAACGWNSQTVTSLEQLRKVLQQPVRGLSVIEVPIPRPDEVLRDVRRAGMRVLTQFPLFS